MSIVEKEFEDIKLLSDNMSPVIKHQLKQMNLSNTITLNKFYPDGFNCICGKKVKILHSHLKSKKHKNFCEKHGIDIRLNIPEKKLKPKPIGPKNPVGRPRKYDINESLESKKERQKKYMNDYFDNDEEKRLKQNERVAKFRDSNRELCRQRVRESRRKKREKGFD
jgi:hypothetical protein